MTVKEIIQIENGNRNTIILLREGIFWRAYEKSAYAFSMQVHPFLPSDSVATGLRTASAVLTSKAKLPWTACCSLWN